MLPQVYIRFYEELNDFLPILSKKKDILYNFKGSPTIKDLIEALGVPHTEVDLILVNGNSVTFSYKVQNGDRISVYPVFETLDISPIMRLRSLPLRSSKFIADVHLGKLTRYLRLLGFDTEFKTHLQDREIALIAHENHRIVLTRDKGLLKNKIVTHGYWLRHTDSFQQVLEVLQRFDLKNQIKPFSRCLICNGEIMQVNKEDIISNLPEQTQLYYREFSQCNQCKKIYWAGAHYSRLKKLVKDLISS